MRLNARLNRLARQIDPPSDADRCVSVADAMKFERESLARVRALGDRPATGRADREAVKSLLARQSHRALFKLDADATDAEILSVGRARGLTDTDMDCLAQELTWDRLPFEQKVREIIAAQNAGRTPSDPASVRPGRVPI